MVEAGMPPMFQERRDLLFNAPAIQVGVPSPYFDVLVISAPPRSGQCPGWDQGEMDGLIQRLSEKYSVLTTNETQVSSLRVNTVLAPLSAIGNLSMRAKFVVMVATGPSWGVHNIWTGHIPTYVFLNEIVLDYGRKNLCHAKTVTEMTALLTRDGWI